MFNEALGDFHLDGLATNQTGALTQAASPEAQPRVTETATARRISAEFRDGSPRLARNSAGRSLHAFAPEECQR